MQFMPSRTMCIKDNIIVYRNTGIPEARTRTHTLQYWGSDHPSSDTLDIATLWRQNHGMSHSLRLDLYFGLGSQLKPLRMELDHTRDFMVGNFVHSAKSLFGGK